MGYKKTGLMIGGSIGIAFPHMTFAQEWTSYVGDTLTILDVYIFWSIVVLALVAIGMVFRNAKKMKGGVFGGVLTLFGLGMTVTFLGFVATSVHHLFPVAFETVLPDVLFIVGYVFMAIAASRLARAIR